MGIPQSSGNTVLQRWTQFVESCNNESSAGPQIVGVYPRGFAHEALAELSLVGGVVSAHYEAHCTLLFRLSEHQGAFTELGTFSSLFELVGDPIHLCQEPSLEQLREGASAEILRSAPAWRTALKDFKRWRCNIHRVGDHKFKTPDIVSCIADTLSGPDVEAVQHREFTEDGCSNHGPRVDLKNYDVEVMVYLSDGFDVLRNQADYRWNRAASRQAGSRDLLVLGVRSNKTKCRSVELWLETEERKKKLETKQRCLAAEAHDAVSFCVAYKAIALMPNHSLVKGVLRVLDPMCGMGTLLLALRWVHLHRLAEEERVQFLEILGAEIEADKLFEAHSNAAGLVHDDASTRSALAPLVHISFVVARNDSLPFPTASIDLIVVDPPWGFRHNSHSYVKKQFPRWAREWARVLRPGGTALMITVCKALVDKVFAEMRSQALEGMERYGFLEVKDVIAFDNKGFGQCKLYVLLRSENEI